MDNGADQVAEDRFEVFSSLRNAPSSGDLTVLRRRVGAGSLPWKPDSWPTISRRECPQASHDADWMVPISQEQELPHGMGGSQGGI